MKKVTLLAICLFVAVVGAQAQIALGIKGGLNFANSNVGDALGDPDSKTGYHAGLFMEIGAGGIAIQPEVLYSFKGADDIDLSYVEVPILLKKNFAKVLNIHIGPQFGFLTKAESNTFEGLLDLAGQNTDLKESMKSTEVSAVVGAGVNAPFGLAAGVRYVFGLSDVWDNKLIDTEVKNRTVQLYVGWKFAGN